MDTRKKTTMSIREMGQLLGIKKTDSYWLVHKECFKTVLVQGVMRVDIENFEHWYANQIKCQKVDGSPPGEELRAYSYSIAEMAALLDVSTYVVYSLIKRYNIASTSSVHAHLRTLEEKGYIARKPECPRTILILH